MKRTQLVLGGKKPAKLTLRLSEADAELIRQAADEARQSLNLWCREALVKAAQERKESGDRPNITLKLRDYTVDTHQFSPGTIGEMNGGNHPDVAIPENNTVAWLLAKPVASSTSSVSWQRSGDR